MPLSIPPELKKLTPFVRRAEELDKDKSSPESRLVAYYCRQYAVHTGIPLATSPPGKACLGELLSHLENEKTAMDAFTRDEAKFLCRQFADKIFNKADSEDRAGQASKDTAKTFYAAASFLEILQQFYKDDDATEDHEEEKKRIVYAKWKATDILKAIKEGRKPTAGGYGEEDSTPPAEDDETEVATGGESNDTDNTTSVVETVTEDEEEADTAAEPMIRPPVMEEEEEEAEEGTEVELGPPPSYPAQPPPPESAPRAPASSDRPPMTFSPPPVPPPMPAPPVVKPQAPASPPKKNKFFGFGGKKNKASKAQLADATELTKFALAALEEKDVDLAVDRLKNAIKALGR